ncbi:MAG: PadR family transcriptional regulator [Sedimentibacter sp.]|nr:PadR family transcriptional regulator [Sedimentibacter sp.]
MSINYAILGILSYRSMTGYDIKKVIQDSSFMYWSGNNNQIYKSLIEMHNNGLVTNVVKHQESSPTKKVYIITNEGVAALKEWVLSPSELIEIKKPFLVQLAWSKQLNTNELIMLLDGYENQIKTQLLMNKSNKDKNFLPDRSALETTIWSLINDNIRRTYESELIWIQDLRNAIATIPNENDADENAYLSVSDHEDKNQRIIKYKVISNSELTYVHFNDSETKLETERNILDVITAIAENDAQYAIIDGEALSKDFFELKKGLVETMLQKFTMYHIKCAIIINDMNSMTNEFRDSFVESGKNDVLRLFANIAHAEKWFFNLYKAE